MSVPRRSVLFMPGTNQRAMEKACSLEVDSVILDLEDSILPEAKVTARASIASAMSALEFGYREVLIRINALDSAWWREDLLMAMQTSAQGIVIPKVESARQLHSVIDVIQEQSGGVRPLWPMLESPAGILAAASICSADASITAVLLGTADLGKEMGLPAQADRLGLLPALGQAVLAARAAGISVIDGVYMNIRDQQGLEAECRQGRAMGFDGKSLIHPLQLDISNQIFSPAPTAIEHAQLLLAAWQKSIADGAGVCVVNDQLVEHLHVQSAEKLLALAAQIENRKNQKSGD